MPIFIEGNQVQLINKNNTNDNSLNEINYSIGKELLELVTENKTLKEQSKKVLQNDNNHYISSSNEERIVHVLQHEYACAESKDIDWIGSNDATTCVIIILTSIISNKTVCGHFDGGNLTTQILGVPYDNNKQQQPISGSFVYMFSLFNEEERKHGLDIHMIGSQELYDDKDDNEDHSLIESILYVLYMIQNININIITCIVASENTIVKENINNNQNNNHQKKNIIIKYPKATCLYYHPKSNRIITNWHVEDLRGKWRGPEVPLRSTRHSMSNGNELGCVYSTNDGCYKIERFINKMDNQRSITTLLYLLSLSDSDYLNVCSTSPMSEPDNFVEDSKEGIRFILCNPDFDEYFDNMKQ